MQFRIFWKTDVIADSQSRIADKRAKIADKRTKIADKPGILVKYLNIV